MKCIAETHLNFNDMKSVTIENFIGKMNADYFIHIDVPPGNPKIATDFPMRVMVAEEIMNDELGIKNYVPLRFEADIISIIRFGCFDAPNVLCLLSHGMEDNVFVKYWVAHTEGGSVEDELCAYVFRKANDVVTDTVTAGETKKELF